MNDTSEMSDTSIKLALADLQTEEHRKIKALFLQLIVLIILSFSIATLVALAMVGANQRQQLMDQNDELIVQQRTIINNLCDAIDNQRVVIQGVEGQPSVTLDDCIRLDLAPGG